jgi:long-chain acyl-CoA synthetase
LAANCCCYCIGGAALCPEVELFLREAGFPFAIGYGIDGNVAADLRTGPENTAYRASRQAPVRRGDARSIIRTLKPGRGKFLVRGPVVMKGYFQDAKRTDEVLDRDGWFRTGDLGRV